MENMEEKLRALLKTARNCPICTQVMLEGLVVPGCQVLHMACRECCSKAQYCTQCKINLAYSPLGPMAAAFMHASAPVGLVAPGVPGTSVIPNPRVARPKNTTLCCYSANGCEYNCPNHLLNSHQLECRFRKYDCLGKSTDSFKCDWKGLQDGLIQHIMSDHANNWGKLSFRSERHVSINQGKEMQVFNAHGKTFVYVMKKDTHQHRFYWIILLIGTKAASENYVYEFEIYKPDDNVRKIKFVEICDSDATPLTEIISSEKCVVVSENLLRTYLIKGNIHFRFWIKNVERNPKNDKNDKGKDYKRRDDKGKDQKDDNNEKKDFQKGDSKKAPRQYKKKIVE